MENQRGKRHFEGALYFIVACIAMAVFYGWIMRLAEPAERMRVQYTLANLRSAVQVAQLSAIVADDAGAIRRLAHTNPMDLMQAPPPSYEGELSDLSGARPGRWYYDASAGELLYRLSGKVDGEPAFRRFQLQYRPADIKRAGPGRLELVEQAGVSP